MVDPRELFVSPDPGDDHHVDLGASSSPGYSAAANASRLAALPAR
jgi:hypothetical protein